MLYLTRTLSVPFFTFTPHAYPSNTHSHSPQRTHQSPCTNAHGLRAMHTSNLLLSTTLKRKCSLPPPLRPPCLRAPCSAHGSDHASRTEQAIAERLWRARSAPTGQSLCESYFAITRMDGGGVHTPHERERWPAIVSSSRREWSHHITPEIPIG